MSKIQELTAILRRIDQGESPATVAARHAQFLEGVTPIDIALAEQQIFEAEQDIDRLRRTCARHIQIIDRPANHLREALTPGHVLRRMLSAHEMILCLMVDLADLDPTIDKLDQIRTTDPEYRKFVHIVSHVSATQEHFSLEEESVFPALSAAGMTALVEGFKKDHDELAQCTDGLLELMYTCCRTDFKQFKAGLSEVIQWLVPFKREHIFKEDNLLYPIAFELIEEEAVWEHLGAKCETVGYCCFLQSAHPAAVRLSHSRR